MRISVYCKGSTNIRCVVAVQYVGIFLKVSKVVVKELLSPTLIPFEVGDYLDYRGKRYQLYTLPKPSKQATRGSSKDAFEYKDINFLSATQELEIAPFRDLVLNDNLIHYTSLPDINTFENVYGIANRVQACMNDMYPDKWIIRVVDTTDTELLGALSQAKAFSASKISCLGALEQIYNLWKVGTMGIGWVHTIDATTNKNIITLGKPCIQDSSNTTNPFLYGQGNGLRAIRQGISNKDELATRLFVYGSTRNMPSRYYNKKTTAEYFNIIPPSAYIPNLMLPISAWGSQAWQSWNIGNNSLYLYTLSANPIVGNRAYTEPNEWSSSYPITNVTANTITADTLEFERDIVINTPLVKKAYLQAEASILAKYGIRPKSVYFDGTDDKDEIYPSIEGMTAKMIRDAKSSMSDTTYIPSTSIYPDNEMMDAVKSATYPPDSGEEFSSGNVYKEEVAFSQSQIEVSATVMADEPIIISKDIYSATITQVGRCKLEIGNFGKIDNFEELPYVWAEVLGDGNVIHRISGSCVSSPTSHELYLDDIEFDNTDVLSVKVRVIIEFRPPIGCSYIYTIYAKSGFWRVSNVINRRFEITIKQIGFDISKRASSKAPLKGTIAMKSGDCGGREFDISGVRYNTGTDDWTLSCVRQFDSALQIHFPNSVYRINRNGQDKFVIIDIEMPDLYVEAASSKLLDYGRKELDRLKVERSVYEPEIDSFQIERSGETLVEGMYMRLEDNDIIEGIEYVLIDSLEIDESESGLPKYKVVLRDEKRYGLILSQERAVKRVSQSVVQVVNVMQQVPSEAITKSSEVVSGGVNDYNELRNLPKINGKQLIHDRPLSELGISPTIHDHNGQVIRPRTLALPDSPPLADHLIGAEIGLYLGDGEWGAGPTSGGGTSVVWGTPTANYVPLSVAGVSKDLSLATHLHDDRYYTEAEINTLLGNKVDKDGSKVLTDVNFTSALKTKLDGIEIGANKYTHPSTHPASIITESDTKRFVSDTEKATWNSKADGDHDHANRVVRPRSFAIPLSVPTSGDLTSSEVGLYLGDGSWGAAPTSGGGTSVTWGTETSNYVPLGVDGVYKNVSLAGHIHDYSPSNHNHNSVYSLLGHTHDDRYYTETEITTLLSGKVDKVSGYALSKNDFTDTLKTKLDGIAYNANNYVLPPASASVLGGVKVGTRLEIDSNGVLSATYTYTHPASHDASMIVENANKRFVTDVEKNTWSGKADATHDHINQLLRPSTFVVPQSTPSGLIGTEIGLYLGDGNWGANPTSGGGTSVTWGTETTNYVPLNVANVTKNLSLSGHKHTQIDITDFAHTHTKAQISDITEFGRNLISTDGVISNRGSFNMNLASYNSYSSDDTGAIVINLPNTWSWSMNYYEIDIYEYNSNGASKIIIGGYNYTPRWVNTSVTVIGKYDKLVRLAHNETKCCIILGDINTVWSYPKVYLTTVLTGHLDMTSWWSGYSITPQVTNLSTYTQINVPTKLEYASSLSTSGNNIVLSSPSGQLSSIVAPAATKLQTARTLWEQSFDGSGNVNGDLTSSGKVTASGFYKTDSSNSYVLLGGGSHKLVSDFATNNIDNLITFSTRTIGYDTTPYKLGRLQGYLEIPENLVYGLSFRVKHTSETYGSQIKYATSGEEALIFANNYHQTSFIFKCGILPSSFTSDWTGITNPSLQIKRQSVYINELIADGVVPSYNFLVNGTSRFKGNIEADATITASKLISSTLVIPQTTPSLSGSEIGLYLGDGTWGASPTSGGGTSVTWGTPTANYVPLSVAGASKDLSLYGHTHDYANKVKVGTTEYSVSSNMISLPAYPTTLPASDVYAWAKSSTKPSYSLSEIQNIVQAGNEFNFIPAGYNQTAVWLNYRCIDRSSGSISQYWFGNGNGGVADIRAANIYSSGNLVLHAGNYNSYITQSYINGLGISASYATSAGNAEKVVGLSITSGDNKPWGTIPAITNSGYMDVGKHFEFHYDNTTGSDYSTILMCTGNYSNIVNLPSVSGTIALLTDNVASATKLQTARTIWGQSFDGSANVSGIACFSNGDLIYAKDEGGTDRYIMGLTSVLSFGYGTASAGIDTHILGKNIHFRYYDTGYKYAMSIQNNGNVLIGTTSDWGYKLDVHGSAFISSNGDHGILIGAGANTIDAWRVNGNSTNLFLNWQSSGNVILAAGGGNVGIGTTSPAYKLHVAGKGYFSDTLIVNQSTVGDYNEGIRLVRTSSGWSNIQIGCDDGASGFNSSYQWLVGSRLDGVFNISEAGKQSFNTAAGSAGIYVRRGTSSYGKLVVSNDTNEEASIGYCNTTSGYTYPIWTVGAGIGGSGYRFGWWYFNVGCKMYLTESGDLNVTGNISASGTIFSAGDIKASLDLEGTNLVIPTSAPTSPKAGKTYLYMT